MKFEKFSARWIALLVIVLTVAVSGAVALTVAMSHRSLPADASPSDETGASSPTNTDQPSDEPENGVLVLSFTGAVAPASLGGGSVYGTFNQYFSETAAAPLTASLAPYLQADTLSFCSLAAVFSDRELSESYTTVRPYLHMKASASAAAVLSGAGWDAAAVLSTHCRDYGEEGLADTQTALAARNVLSLPDGMLLPVGKDGSVLSVLVLCSDGKAEEVLIRSVTLAARQTACLVVYDCCDDTAETSSTLRVLYRQLVDAGARMVVGCHGDSLFASEMYNGAYLFPAIGPFLTGMEPLSNALLLRVTLTVENGRVISTEPELLPFAQNADWSYSYLGGTEAGNAFLSRILP